MRLQKPCEVTKLWVWSKEKTSSDGERSAHSLPLQLSLSLLFVVDHSMFENLNTALLPKLQSSRSVPHLSRPTAPSSAASGVCGARGPGLWVGSSQHLKSLGKVVGAKVNDFLRRKEPSSLGSVGTTEVNKTAGPNWRGADVWKVEYHLSPPCGSGDQEEACR